jgi:hypothetical protein
MKEMYVNINQTSILNTKVGGSIYENNLKNNNSDFKSRIKTRKFYMFIFFLPLNSEIEK